MDNLSQRKKVIEIMKLSLDEQLKICKEELSQQEQFFIRSHYDKCIKQKLNEIKNNMIDKPKLYELLNSDKLNDNEYLLCFLLLKLHTRNRECIIKKIKTTNDMNKIEQNENYIMKVNQFCYCLILNDYHRNYKYGTIKYKINDKRFIEIVDKINMNENILKSQKNIDISNDNGITTLIKQTFNKYFNNSEMCEKYIYNLIRTEDTEKIRKRIGDFELKSLKDLKYTDY